MRLMGLQRMRRRTFWWSSTLVWVVFFTAREALGIERQAAVATAWAATAVLSLGTLAVARLRDRSRSGWWLAAGLVPVAGALWLAWELALRRGSRHANAYGPDPRHRSRQ
jgi:uncharacterized membrane protein YhaH (DUF805 family)